MLQAERIVLKRTADVIDRELGHPPDWAHMTDSNTQLFEVDLSEPTVAGLVTSLREVGATVVKASPYSMPGDDLLCNPCCRALLSPAALIIAKQVV